MRSKLSVIALLAGSISALQLHSQALSQSPYGRYGIGDLLYTSHPQWQGLGGGHNVLLDSSCLNLGQPAALRSIGRGVVVFEVGISGLSTRFITSATTKTGTTAGFGYFGLAFPVVRNFWSSSLSLVPLSNVGYSLRDTLADDGQATYFSYTGNGGFSAFGFGNAFQIRRDIALGVNVRYLFGKVDYSSETVFTGAHLRNSRLTSSVRLSDIDYTFGLTAQHRFRRPYKKVRDTTAVSGYKRIPSQRDSVHLVAGFTFSPSVNISGSTSYLAESFFRTGSPTLITDYLDTILFVDNQKGRVTLPMQAGGGLTLRNAYNRWLVTADITYTDWNGFRMFDRVDSVRSSFRLSAGFQWYPRPEEKYPGKSSYLSRIRYRAGGYYSDGYLRIGGNPVPEYGISIGFGLPVVTRTYMMKPVTNLLNISITAGQRGQTGINLLSEQFIRLGMGFSMNDRWFKKRQYD